MSDESPQYDEDRDRESRESRPKPSDSSSSSSEASDSPESGSRGEPSESDSLSGDSPTSSSPTQHSEGVIRRDPDQLIGVTFDHRYRIEEYIGKGGMAVVYRAYQEALDRQVVVKVLPEALVHDSEAVARFEREARRMSQLEHPHVVSTYDFGQEGHLAYICMEYVEGETLYRRVQRQPLSIPIFATIATQILQGIGDAHAMGMIHRDIKAANIMLCERRGCDHYVKLLDFGLAKLLKGSSNVTQEQKLVGSAPYLSPEQIQGESLDERIDIYSLGVLFYYMLTGHPPFEGEDNMQVLYQHVQDAPPPLEDQLPEGVEVPDGLAALIHQCLAKSPNDRPDDANALLEAFTSVVPSHNVRLPWSTDEFSGISGPDSEIEEPSGDIDTRASPDETSASDASSHSGIPSRLPMIFAALLITGGLGTLGVLLTGSDDRPRRSSEASKEVERAISRSDEKARAATSKQSHVNIDTDPPGEVRLDDERLGRAPLKTTVPPGEHTLYVEAEHHKTWDKTFTFEPGETHTFDVTLASKEKDSGDERETPDTPSAERRPSSGRADDQTQPRETGGTVSSEGGRPPGTKPGTKYEGEASSSSTASSEATSSERAPSDDQEARAPDSSGTSEPSEVATDEENKSGEPRRESSGKPRARHSASSSESEGSDSSETSDDQDRPSPSEEEVPSPSSSESSETTSSDDSNASDPLLPATSSSTDDEKDDGESTEGEKGLLPVE